MTGNIYFPEIFSGVENSRGRSVGRMFLWGEETQNFLYLHPLKTWRPERRAPREAWPRTIYLQSAGVLVRKVSVGRDTATLPCERPTSTALCQLSANTK